MGKVKKEKMTHQVAETKSKAHSPKKKKSSENKCNDSWSRKYFYILPESIKIMAETVGISHLSDEVAGSLAEDVSYRLRSIVQVCTKYLKHTRHKRLTCQDMNEVLAMCDIPAVHGYDTPDSPLKFSSIREASFLIMDDPEVDLAKYALTDTMIFMKPPSTLTGRWLTPDERNKLRLDDIKTEPIDGANKSFPAVNHLMNSHTKNDTDIRNDNHKVNSEQLDNEPKIPTNLVKYYGVTCNTILGRSDLKLVLRDLSQNGKIVSIVPYLLNFITITLRKLGNERTLKRLLQTIEALTDNNKIDFAPYHPVTRVINVLLKIVKASPVGSSPFTRNHDLRIRAAQVLGRVMHKWCCNIDQRDEIISNMARLLRDPQTPSVVLVGALTLITNLGVKALQTAFWGNLGDFLSNMDQSRHDFLPIDQAVQNASRVLYQNPHFEEAIGISSTPKLDCLLYEYFGDSIEASRLHMLENPLFLYRFFPPPTSLTHTRAAESIVKRPWRLPKCRNSIYNPEAKRLTIHTAFTLPKKKRNHRMIFKFEGARPVPEISLRRRRMDTPYSQFIAGKVSEGHVVLVGKICKRLHKGPNIYSSASLFTVL